MGRGGRACTCSRYWRQWTNGCCTLTAYETCSLPRVEWRIGSQQLGMRGQLCGGSGRLKCAEEKGQAEEEAERRPTHGGDSQCEGGHEQRRRRLLD